MLHVWRYLPPALLFRVSEPDRLFAMALRPVTGAAVYRPHTHPQGCPLRPDWWALAVTGLGAAGPRWYGFADPPVITSELRLAVLPDPRFAELARWPSVPQRVVDQELVPAARVVEA